MTCFIMILWNIKCIAIAILQSDDDMGSCLTEAYVSMPISSNTLLLYHCMSSSLKLVTLSFILVTEVLD